MKKSPTVATWWGFVLSLAMAAIVAGLQVSGCTPPEVKSTDEVIADQPALTPLAPLTPLPALTDSLGLAEFLALPESLRSHRRSLAGDWLDQADAAGLADVKIKALTKAAGLAPDNQETWLGLAHILRWYGDYVGTSTCLENAAAAVRKLSANYSGVKMREAQRRTALARAWLHYDRAEYREGLRWARAGEQLSPGDIWIRQVQGLLEGSLNHRSQALEIAGDMTRAYGGDPDPSWVKASLDRAQGNFREAFNYIAPLRPDHEHSAECYRDKGEIAEQLGEWSYARQWYAESAHAVPVGDSSPLTEITYARLDPYAIKSSQPVWLAFGRYYVTGSLSAYTALALDRFDQETNPEVREFWAGQVVDAAGILLRKDFHRAWSLRARGIVFADKGITDRALKDLVQASGLLATEGRSDWRTEALIGHIMLLKEDHEKALPHLQAAVGLDPTNAVAWSDLGLCLIMAGDRDEAAEFLTRAIDLQPNLAVAWYNRGLMNLHAGNLDQAEADLDRAAQLAPGSPDVAKLLQQVHLRRRQN